MAASAITRPRIAGAQRCCSNAVEAVTKSDAVTPVATPATAANARFG